MRESNANTVRNKTAFAMVDILCVYVYIFIEHIIIFFLLHCCHDASVASHSSSDGNSLQQCEEQMPHSSA